MSYLLILAVEELLDYINRATMRDERVHPVSRQIAKLHVLEEARHVSFAKTYLSRGLAADPRRRRRATIADAAPALVAVVAESQHRSRGLRASRHRATARIVARVNPHHRAVIVAGLAKLTGFLAEIGVIMTPRRPTWAALGLLA